MLRLLALLFKTECITRNSSESTFGLAYVLETMHGSTCHAKEIALLLIKVVEQWVVEPSVGLPGEINHRFVAACNALQNLFACS
uniref:Uncharacterized protein n=1 Tax=Ciona savignyi TaxID=51511 RepID=H2YGG4_CIOSA